MLALVEKATRRGLLAAILALAASGCTTDRGCVRTVFQTEQEANKLCTTWREAAGILAGANLHTPPPYGGHGLHGGHNDPFDAYDPFE